MVSLEGYNAFIIVKSSTFNDIFTHVYVHIYTNINTYIHIVLESIEDALRSYEDEDISLLTQSLITKFTSLRGES